MLPLDGLLLVKSAAAHGTTGVGLASALVTSVAWEGLRPGLAPLVAAAVAVVAVAWLERRRSGKGARLNTPSHSLGPTSPPASPEVRRAPAARWRVSKHTGRPALSWE